MTAKELHDVVKDVPKEAWPRVVFHALEWYRQDDHFIIAELRRDPDDVEQMFIGSMVKWLLDKELVVWQGTEDGVFRVGEWNSSTAHEGASILAALAAACKAVGGAE